MNTTTYISLQEMALSNLDTYILVCLIENLELNRWARLARPLSSKMTFLFSPAFYFAEQFLNRFPSLLSDKVTFFPKF